MIRILFFTVTVFISACLEAALKDIPTTHIYVVCGLNQTGDFNLNPSNLGSIYRCDDESGKAVLQRVNRGSASIIQGPGFGLSNFVNSNAPTCDDVSEIEIGLLDYGTEPRLILKLSSEKPYVRIYNTEGGLVCTSFK